MNKVGLILIFAILAFTTTSGFDTEIKFNLTCRVGTKGVPVYKAVVPIKYPFDFDDQIMKVPKSCVNENQTEDKETLDLSCMGFSSSAQFFVATGVLSSLYSTAALVLYILGTRHYESNPLVPVIDLAITAMLTFFWLSGTSAWAVGVSDVKHYTKAPYLWSKMDFCDERLIEDNDQQYCMETCPGKFTLLNFSLLFGFVNILLWTVSSWLVFKETHFFKKPIPNQMDQGQPESKMSGEKIADKVCPHHELPFAEKV